MMTEKEGRVIYITYLHIHTHYICICAYVNTYEKDNISKTSSYLESHNSESILYPVAWSYY